MAKHDMTAQVPPQQIRNTDLTVEIRADGELFGDLVVSKGSISWRASGHHYVFKMGWQKFDKMMRDNGTAWKQQ
jgi:hypothetical protein